MNKPLPANLFRSCWAGVLVMLVGCGGSDAPSSDVVSPPDHSAPISQESESEAPGTLELPSMDIPPPDDEPAEVEAGGLELPPDVEIPETNSAAPVGGPQVLYATWDSIQAEVTASGKVTVVDLWSLACEPCLKEFPGLVDLHQTHGEQVQCVAVDLDYDGRKSRPPNYYEERVLEFLQSVSAFGFPTYICETPSDDVFAATELVSIPAVLVYDDQGELVKTFVDAGPEAGFTYHDDVTPFVQRLAKD